MVMTPDSGDDISSFPIEFTAGWIEDIFTTREQSQAFCCGDGGSCTLYFFALQASWCLNMYYIAAKQVEFCFIPATAIYPNYYPLLFNWWQISFLSIMHSLHCGLNAHC